MEYGNNKTSEKSDEVRMVIKWIFYLTIGFIIYVSLKFINEREITLPQVGADLSESTVKVTTRAIEDGAVAGKDVVEKSTYVTKDILAKGISITKQIITKNIEEMNNPQKPKAAAQQPANTAGTKSPGKKIEDSEDIEIEQREYNYPLF